MGVNDLRVEQVPDPRILNDGDVIVRVDASAVCGSDLHLIDGYVPAMRRGDVLGHEFLGTVVEAGSGVTRHRVDDRVVVCSILACGGCWYCQRGEFSLCDNSNVEPGTTEQVWGYAAAGIFGYSHLTGGYPGSHAEYIRVPYADTGAFPVPGNLSDDAAVFASDAVPTGWMAADLCGLTGGEVVAVWGAGGVGLMAARAAQLLGAERVVVIDRIPSRLRAAEDHLGVETLDYSATDVGVELRELTAGRGPDACIEAVGMESHGTGPQYAYDRVKQAVRAESDRAVSLRQAIHACRKGGTVSVIGVYGGFVDKFPMGAAMNKALTIRAGQQFGQKYIPMLLERMAAGEIDPGFLATHPMPLDEAPHGYQLFKQKEDGCLRAVFHPSAVPSATSSAASSATSSAPNGQGR